MIVHPYAAICLQHGPVRGSGADGAVVEALPFRTLAMAVSRHETIPEPTAGNIAAHHQVQMALLNGGSIVPFRFGNVFSSDEHLRQEVEARAEELGAKLDRLAGCVELTVRLPREGGEQTETNRTGTRYLLARKQQADAEQKLKAQLNDLVKDWRRDRRGSEVRLACLIDPERVAELRRRAPHLAVTGPWPPSSFV